MLQNRWVHLGIVLLGINALAVCATSVVHFAYGQEPTDSSAAVTSTTDATASEPEVGPNFPEEAAAETTEAEQGIKESVNSNSDDLQFPSFPNELPKVEYDPDDPLLKKIAEEVGQGSLLLPNSGSLPETKALDSDSLELQEMRLGSAKQLIKASQTLAGEARIRLEQNQATEAQALAKKIAQLRKMAAELLSECN